ncbi:hypothetical protein [Desulfitobacterium chlororespirans]|uniref:Uncharacterized protein n=1 Tax=Desulfitobacterium chlororespirans DSM 11544 TaxID=1121395 RepID=A0A1M7TVT0_9FIRM|nr:hypothetical protein SAMN02745215_02570 [Desulfitobacterium chlororespirans DSM 11544]
MLKDNLSAYGSNVYTVIEDEERAIYQIKDRTGDGMMICYAVFPGAYLSYNNFHMHSCDSKFKTAVDMFCIDHCREGRIEQDMGNGPISINCRWRKSKPSRPL